MLRASIAAIALLALPSCAHPQSGDPVGRGDLPDVRATANVIIQALPETQHRDWGYRWDAMSTRLSRFVRWRVYAPDPRADPPDTIVRRNGWIDGEHEDVGVSAFGADDAVTMLSFEYDRFYALDLLEGLRRAGADVRFQADYETYSEYVIVAPGREWGLLTTRRTCTPENWPAAARCQDSVELTFDPFDH